MVSVGLARWLGDCPAWLDTMEVINLKLCMMVLLMELYLFIPLSVTLTTFQGHRSVEQFYRKILFSSD